MGRYLNPVLPGCHPDPSVCRVGDTFYLVTSSFEYLPGLPVHASQNLVDWTQIGHVIDRPEQLDLAGLPSSRGLFAPTIRHDGERFYVVCTVVGPDDGSWAGRTGHFVVTALDAAGPFSDPVWIDGIGGIDPSLTFDGDRVWLTGTRLAANPGWNGQTEVWLVELDAASLQPLSDASVIWGGALLGSVWAEGPHIVRHPAGGWMLVAAEGGTSRDHAVCVAYASEIAGPYAGDPGNPRLTHRDLGRTAEIASVGHADLVDDDAGRTWATVLATHTVGGADGLLGRQTHLVPVAFEDGRAVFSPGSGRVPRVGEAEGLPDQQAPRTDFSDDFSGPSLSFAWNGVGRHPPAFASLGDRAGGLRLTAGAEPGSLGAQSFLGRRLPASDANCAVTLDAPSASASGTVRGGLLLRTSELAYLEVSIDDAGVVRCVTGAAGVTTVLAEMALADNAAEGNPTEDVESGDLEAGCNDAGVLELSVQIRGLDGVASVNGVPLCEADLTALVPDPASGFVGAWIGPFAVGAEGGAVTVKAVSLTRP